MYLIPMKTVLPLLLAVAVICGCGADVPTTGTDSVYVKAQQGDVNSVSAAVRSGFDVNQPDESGKTLLHHAAAGGHSDLVETLVEELHAKAAVTDSVGKTPLDYAKESGNALSVETLEGAM